MIEDFATDGPPDVLIVVDKLLTGFDEPRNAVLYIDKHLKGHNLLQAVARVNRLHEAKQYGYLIDYRGILAELGTSIHDYQDLAEQTQAGFEIDDLVGLVRNVSTEYKRLPALHHVLWAIFRDVRNKADWEQFRQVLVPQHKTDEAGETYDRHQKVREEFYEALTAFGMCLKLQEPPGFRLLDMSRQWGSCSPTGTIILNPNLVRAPRECVGYVLVHELAHLKYHDHGADFWDLVSELDPDWQKNKKTLDALAEVILHE